MLFRSFYFSGLFLFFVRFSENSFFDIIIAITEVPDITTMIIIIIIISYENYYHDKFSLCFIAFYLLFCGFYFYVVFVK